MDFFSFLFIISCALAIGAIVLTVTFDEPAILIFTLVFAFTAIFSLCGYCSLAEDSWECCGDTITSEYCCECGKEKPAECKGWKCCNHELGKDINFCPDCGKAKPVNNSITNNIIVKDNENVEVNINSDGVVIVEDDIKSTETNNDTPTTVPDSDT